MSYISTEVVSQHMPEKPDNIHIQVSYSSPLLPAKEREKTPNKVLLNGTDLTHVTQHVSFSTEVNQPDLARVNLTLIPHKVDIESLMESEVDLPESGAVESEPTDFVSDGDVFVG